MEAQNNQTLFRCRDRAKTFPGLSGISFRIMDHLPLKDALCVFGGTQCTFNNMVDFVAEHSTFREGYQFGISGLMFLVPNRISQRTIPSVPIIEGKMVVLGPRDPAQRRRDTLRTIIQPFRWDAWMMLGATLALLLVLSFLKYCLYTEKKKRSFYNYVRSLVGDDVSDPIFNPKNASELTMEERKWLRGLQEESKLMNKVSGTALGLAGAALLTISILFYEIAVVNYIFAQTVQHLGKDVQNLTQRELSNYLVMGSAAQEIIWRKTGTFGLIPLSSATSIQFFTVSDLNHLAYSGS